MSHNESKRVVVHEERRNASWPLHFKKVDIKYSDGTLFYSGWIQDFGDARTGPTCFEQNYKNFNLEREKVVKREKYWVPITRNQSNTGLRDATPEDLDDIVDLNFQNYFDGGNNRISSYQGLNHKIDDIHLTLGFTVDNSIYGFLYIDLEMNAFRGEAYFDSLFCAHSMRNRGVGNALLAAGLDRVKGKGFEKVSGRIMGPPEHCEHIAKILDKHGFKVVECIEQREGWWDASMLKTF
jgi:GNAT superfamily N-acetyltransferase